MTIPNKASRFVWAYESTPGTAEITAVDTTTYEFGHYSDECDKWIIPYPQNDYSFHYNYSERNSKLTANESSFPPIKHSFHPTTAQPFAWIMKNPTTGTPIDLNLLHTGMTTPLTIRHEEKEGTNEHIIQGVGSYCIGLYCRGARDMPLLVECTFIPEAIEDKRGAWVYDDTLTDVTGDTITGSEGGTLNQYAGYLVYVRDGTDARSTYTVASNTAATPTVITLTTTPSCAATDKIILFNKNRPLLTTDPYGAGEDSDTTIPNCYDGNPNVTWDDGGEDIALTECYMVEFNMDQNYTTVSKDEGHRQDVHCYTYKPFNIILSCVFETNKQWYDYVDKEARDIEIKFYKPDMTNYISIIFTNAYVVNCVKTGIKNEGHYEAKMLLNAEDVSGTSNFLNEQPDNFSTYFKAGV